MATTLKRVLVVGGSGFVALERRRLDREGHRVMTARNFDESVAALTHGDADLIVTEYDLPEGMSGLELEDLLAASGHHVPVVMVTGREDEAIMMTAYRAGKRDFPMRSTPHIAGLPDLVNRALEQSMAPFSATDSRIGAPNRLTPATPGGAATFGRYRHG